MLEKFQKYFLPSLVIMLFVFNIFLFHLDKANSKKVLTLAVLNVGQGDAIFIESPTGVQVLIDGGPPQKVLNELSKVMPFWDRHIDALIVTNPDQDHFAGFLDILRLYKTDMIFEPGTINSSDTYKIFQRQIKEKNIPNILARAGTRIHLGGGAYLDILFPDRDVYDWENNMASVVAKLTYGDTTVMLTGDATLDTEEIILRKFKADYLESDYLKAGHHGSKTSSGENFVSIVKPKYAFISSGLGNKYGHPHQEVLDILESNNVNVLRTDELGAIILKSDGKNEKFSFKK